MEVNFNNIILNSLDKTNPNVQRFLRALNGTDNSIYTGHYGDCISSFVKKKGAAHDIRLVAQENGGINFVHIAGDFTNEAAKRLGITKILTLVQSDGKRVIDLTLMDKHAKLFNNMLKINPEYLGDLAHFRNLSLEQVRKIINFLRNIK